MEEELTPHLMGTPPQYEVDEPDIPVNEPEAFDSDMDISSISESDSESDNSDLENDSQDSVNGESSQSAAGNLNTSAPLYIIQCDKFSDGNYSSDISVQEHELALLAYATRHNLSDTGVQQLVDMISLYLPASNLLEGNINKIKERCGFGNQFMKSYLFCNICKRTFEDGAEACQTPNCTGQRNVSTSQSFFMTGNLEVQLKSVLTKKGIWNAIQQTCTKTSKSSTLTDIVDGTEYKKLKEEGMFLSNSNNITLTMFTDGIPLFKSSGTSLWPVYLIINDLPRQKRFQRKNMVLWGVWQGSGKPHMTTFLKPLIEDLQKLYSTGIEIEIDCNTFTCKAMLVVATMDLQARSAVLNMTQHNGEYSCVYCMDQGQVVKSGKGHCRVFPYKDNHSTLRTSDEIKRDGKQAQQSRKKVNGFFGESVFNYLPNFSLNNNIVIDYMHGILLGITKKLLTLWFDRKYVGKPFFIGNSEKEVDRRLKSITPPPLINRLPRKIDTLNHWKASELRSWLMFYCLPCLQGLLPAEHLKHLSLLVEATYILLEEGITEADLKRSNLLLNIFVKTTPRLYDLNIIGLNFHNLLHLTECVRKWGPMWSWSCFCFESFNGEIKKSIHGTGNVCRQIFWCLQATKRIENLSNENMRDKVKLFISSVTDARLNREQRDVTQCIVKRTYPLPDNFRLTPEVHDKLAGWNDNLHLKNFVRAKKIINNGYVMYSKLCSKVKKRNSYTVSVSENVQDNRILEVHYFLINKETSQVFAVGKTLQHIGGVLQTNVPHLQKAEYCG